VNASPSIRIRKMRVRVPGTSQKDGHALVQQLSERLGALQPEPGQEHIGAMRLRIRGEPSMRGAAASIGDSIAAKLARSKVNPHA
jgi:hypothetical protein